MGIGISLFPPSLNRRYKYLSYPDKSRGSRAPSNSCDPTKMAFATPLSLSVRGGSTGASVSRQAARPLAARCTRRVRMSTTTPPPPAAQTERRPGSHKGFVEEMRFVAMRLHTKDQAPREGQQEESALPIDAWHPTRADFMQFLVDSRHVYDYFENQLIEHPLFASFRNTGLERVEALDRDISSLLIEGVEERQASTSATGYVAYMQKLLENKPESALCHWYNYYFAHSAGGRMIGRLMQQRLFDSRNFAFYEWEGDVKEMLGPVRESIDKVAEDWSRDVKDVCLKETGLAFGYSGTILQHLAKDSRSSE